MKENSGLFNLLRTFSRGEILAFKRFLSSPYFSYKSKVLKLYGEIIKYYPLFTHIRLSNERLSKKLFPKLKYKDSTIRNLLSILHSEALHFMQIENFERSKVDRYNFLFRELNLKGLKSEFTKIIDREDLPGDGLIDWSFLLNHHFIETYKFNFSYHNLKLSKKSIVESEISYINNSMNYLIYFFINELVALYLNYVNYKISYNTENIANNIEQAFALINFAELRKTLDRDHNVFIIDIYAALVKMYSKLSSNSVYSEYKDLFFGHINKLSNDEIRFHYSQLIAYCSIKRLGNKSDFDFDSEQLTLYKEMLENSYYIDRNTIHLPHELYRNILLLGLNQKDFIWAESFVKEYSYKVKPQDRENMFSYGSAYLEYYLGNYESALNYINEIDLNFFIYKVDVKNLTLMIYYELEYTEEALTIAKSYREFIRKNKLINPERKNRYVNFSKYVEKLILHKAKSYRYDIGFLRQEIIKNNAVAFKDWLVEKIDESMHKEHKVIRSA